MKSLPEHSRMLKVLLEREDMSITEAADIAGVPSNRLHEWINGTSPTDYSPLKKLANFFGISLSTLLTGEPDDIESNEISIHEVFSKPEQLFEGFLKVRIERVHEIRSSKKNRKG